MPAVGGRERRLERVWNGRKGGERGGNGGRGSELRGRFFTS